MSKCHPCHPAVPAQDVARRILEAQGGWRGGAETPATLKSSGYRPCRHGAW